MGVQVSKTATLNKQFQYWLF